MASTLHLLKIDTYEIYNDYRDSIPGQGVPDYAILSHTWRHDGDEITYQDIQPSNLEAARQRESFAKVHLTSEEAKRQGLSCIDKSSSAELSEAINSMYKWYQEAKVCFVLLSDVGVADGLPALERSRWFTRAWTLQELLAPRNVEFFDYKWRSFGLLSDNALATSVSEATKIPLHLLSGQLALSDYSVAQRFSWAAKRHATRVEDKAYSLLGLVSVHMSLLYGEGTKSFERLQLELIKNSSDHTIFCWPNSDPAFTHHLLAPSVSHFADAGTIISLATPFSRSFVMTNQGLEITLPVHHYSEADSPSRTYGLLRATDSRQMNERYVLLLEKRWNYDENEANYSVFGASGANISSPATVNDTDGVNPIFDERHVSSFARRIFSVGHPDWPNRLDMTSQPFSNFRIQSIIIWKRPTVARSPDLSVRVGAREYMFFPYAQTPAAWLVER